MAGLSYRTSLAGMQKNPMNNTQARTSTTAHALQGRIQRSRQKNALLAALPCPDQEALLAHMELIHLPLGKTLCDYGSTLDEVYFPTTAIVSLLYVMQDGAMTEIAVIGREGVVGMSLFKGEIATCSAVVQSAGYAYRLKSAHLREAFGQGGALPELLMRYTNDLFAQMARNAVSGRHGSIEQKLCRWLLERLDRSPSLALDVTHATISLMLGVRRESITSAAGRLQEAGLIACGRGSITVIDREGLATVAGECYRAATAPAAQD